MTSRRFRSGISGALRIGAAALAIAIAATGTPTLAARLVPDNFFDRIPETNSGQAGVEADAIFHNSDTGIITAVGNVGLSYIGYYANADRMVFNQRTRELLLEGNVTIVDPDGIEYQADRVVVSNGFKDAVLNSMVMVMKDGSTVTGTEARKMRGGITEIDNNTFSPCGDCIDDKGRRIGWQVRAKKFVRNTGEDYIEMTEPVLEILGTPVAWLPWIRMPDLSESGFSMPSTAYGEKIGTKVTVPYTFGLDNGMSLLLMPSLISTQGLLMGAKFSQLVENWGTYSITAHGIYQLDPGAFNRGFGDTETRGAIQTSGRFTPIDHWTVGWSYSAFTDPAFLTDYLIETDSFTTNEAYATYLTADTYADARVQEFVLLGEIPESTQDQQAAFLPKVSVEHVQELGADGGTVRLSGDLVNVTRAADAVSSNDIAYRLGTEEQKVHGTAEADWSKQLVLGAAVVTPMAGLRVDAASYDGASALQPTEETLYSATPIAALDVRVPFVAYDNGNTFLIEPVAQAYYRGGPTDPGITNDDAQSFAFDEANLFSYNKFSGTDRQETGLRANVGVHYQANFADGSYVDAVLGQTFHIAGPNGLATTDAVNAGAGNGLDRDSSDIVAGVRTGFGPVTLSAKARLDLDRAEIAAASTRATYSQDGWSATVDYSYMAADPARGFSDAQQDAGLSLGIPLADYWRLSAGLGWDITAGEMISYNGGITYDDGYFEAGAAVESSGPSLYDPESVTFALSFKLKGADGTSIGS